MKTPNKSSAITPYCGVANKEGMAAGIFRSHKNNLVHHYKVYMALSNEGVT
jgi:hypothetical protein